MAERSNALSELTRFWLQARHGCLVAESIPVKVPHAHSDIDLVAVRPDLQDWLLPDGSRLKMNMILIRWAETSANGYVQTRSL
jgi:hypothetical protein